MLQTGRPRAVLAFRQIGLPTSFVLNVRQIFKFREMTQRNLVFQLFFSNQVWSTGPHPNLTWTQVRAAPFPSGDSCRLLQCTHPPLQHASPHRDRKTATTDCCACCVSFFPLYRCLQQKALTVLLVLCFLVPHVLRRMGASLFPHRSEEYSFVFHDKPSEPASRTTLCLLHPWAAPVQRSERRAGLGVPLPGRSISCSKRKTLRSQSRSDEGSGPRTWSPQWSESAGPGLGVGLFSPQGCLPERQAC